MLSLETFLVSPFAVNIGFGLAALWLWMVATVIAPEWGERTSWQSIGHAGLLLFGVPLGLAGCIVLVISLFWLIERLGIPLLQQQGLFFAGMVGLFLLANWGLTLLAKRRAA